VSARRFFIEGTQEAGRIVEIDGSDARKIARVLRLRPGDRVEIVDSAATTFSASIEDVGRVVRARIVEPLAGNGAGETLGVEVAQAVPKGRRMDFVVEKCTELGARALLPFYCERSVGRDAGAQKVARWRRLARSAAAQCSRRDVPEVSDPLELDALFERFAQYDAVLFAWELAEPVALHDRLRASLPAAGRVLVVIGPEGGFTHAEAESAVARGAVLVSLGPRVLRTDTAAVALLAVIGALAS